MTHMIEMKRRSEAGFTLVELAIVMVIIGLLIGGILRGQELIANSEVTATIAQVNGIDAGISGFRDKYGVLPGDMATPGARIAGCGAAPVAAPCNGVGNQNGRIDGATPIAALANSENTRAFIHLAVANFGVGIDSANGALQYGGVVPAARVGGGFRLGFNAAPNLLNTTLQAGHALALSSEVATTPIGNASAGAVSGSAASNIDRKLDNGSPVTGSVQSNPGVGCTTGAGVNAVYDETDTGFCNVFFQIQG